jgi:hypothetical protein
MPGLFTRLAAIVFDIAESGCISMAVKNVIAQRKIDKAIGQDD